MEKSYATGAAAPGQAAVADRIYAATASGSRSRELCWRTPSADRPDSGERPVFEKLGQIPDKEFAEGMASRIPTVS